MFDLIPLIQAAGYLGLFAIVFAESGLFFGFFLPGDSLLFTAGFLASQGFLDIYILAGSLFVAAVLGDSVGYAFGNKLGPRIFNKEDSLFFNKAHLVKAQDYFNKYGRKTIIIARFIPAVRTFAPILAGVGKMEYKTFLAFNVIGGFLWAVGLTLAGYFLGSTVPNIDHYIIPIVLLIILLSLSPGIYHIIKSPDARAAILLTVKKILGRKQF